MSGWRALRYAAEALVLLIALVFGVNWLLGTVDAPWWVHMIIGGCLGPLIIWVWVPWRIRRWARNELVNAMVPEQVWVDTGNPFNPRGDGKLQPGDPLFDNVMAPLMNGQFPDGVMVISVDGIHEVRPAPKGLFPDPDLDD